MKYKFMLGLAITTLGLTGCGSTDFTLDSLPSEFQGTWNGKCVDMTDSGSYLESWQIKKGALKNTISLWSQANCPANVSVKKVTVTAVIFTTSTRRKTVSAVCNTGKAVLTRTALSTTSVGDGTQVIKGNQKIRKILDDKKLTEVLPAFDLACLDTNGKLHTGDFSTGDGSSENKRPVEMDATKLFTKQ